MNIPFYDPKRSYEENYTSGPFGAFAEPQTVTIPKGHSTTLFGHYLDVPFGIPAGPLLNSKYIIGAWNWGFSLATYKTVRGEVYPTHPAPNVIRVKTESPNILPGSTVVGNTDVDNIDIRNDGITNSFGVPSKAVSEWQKDATHAMSHAKKGDLMIMSFMGTKHEEMTRDTYIDNFTQTCGEAKKVGAPILEVNFSCPNFGKEGFICNDLAMSTSILEALHVAKGNLPLLVKIGYFPVEQQEILEQLLEAIHHFADGVAAINTIQAKVVDEAGKQLLPGSPVRLFSGICGAKIRWAGLETAERIVSVKKGKGWKDFVVIGVGGVTSADDYCAYRKIGVDAVQSATGAMWNPQLAIDVRKTNL